MAQVCFKTLWPSSAWLFADWSDRHCRHFLHIYLDGVASSVNPSCNYLAIVTSLILNKITTAFGELNVCLVTKTNFSRRRVYRYFYAHFNISISDGHLDHARLILPAGT